MIVLSEPFDDFCFEVVDVKQLTEVVIKWPAFMAIPPWKGVTERKSVDTSDLKQLSIFGNFVWIQIIIVTIENSKMKQDDENKMGKSLF